MAVFSAAVGEEVGRLRRGAVSGMVGLAEPASMAERWVRRAVWRRVSMREVGGRTRGACAQAGTVVGFMGAGERVGEGGEPEVVAVEDMGSCGIGDGDLIGALVGA
jgi:hypothetical protein